MIRPKDDQPLADMIHDSNLKILNKKAQFDYELLDRFEVGVVLTGPEVKSAKLGHVSLAQSYVRIVGSEIWLLNATVSPYKFADNTDYDPARSRKLLMHRHQILNLIKKMESSNLTLIPTAIYTDKQKVKLEVALARGKKQFEKREVMKKRDQEREKQRTLKNFK